MNILQEIDSTLHYENIEKAWHKYKYAFILSLVALFASVAGFNTYNAKVLANAQNDTGVMFDVMYAKPTAEDPVALVINAIEKLKTQQAKDMMNLELAKVYKTQNKTKDYSALLEKLVDSKVKTVKNLAIYMLAEVYLEEKPAKALEFIASVKLSEKASTYSLVEETRAAALVATGDVAQAKEVYAALSADANLPTEQKSRIKIKLDQLG